MDEEEAIIRRLVDEGWLEQEARAWVEEQLETVYGERPDDG